MVWHDRSELPKAHRRPRNSISRLWILLALTALPAVAAKRLHGPSGRN